MPRFSELWWLLGGLERAVAVAVVSPYSVSPVVLLHPAPRLLLALGTVARLSLSVVCKKGHTKKNKNTTDPCVYVIDFRGTNQPPKRKF
jgi:hypothetical protein